jgi:hypothetical protein
MIFEIRILEVEGTKNNTEAALDDWVIRSIQVNY